LLRGQSVASQFFVVVLKDIVLSVYHAYRRTNDGVLETLVCVPEAIPNPFDFAQGSAALEVAALSDCQIKFDRLLVEAQISAPHVLPSARNAYKTRTYTCSGTSYRRKFLAM
jgi:hypothetical protein